MSLGAKVQERAHYSQKRGEGKKRTRRCQMNSFYCDFSEQILTRPWSSAIRQLIGGQVPSLVINHSWLDSFFPYDVQYNSCLHFF